MTPAGMPVLSAHELIRILERAGFVLLRKSKGSYWQFQHIEMKMKRQY
jgi:predicted RNA binding protein YcfA (HicA-like mRNA interferase family)